MKASPTSTQLRQLRPVASELVALRVVAYQSRCGVASVPVASVALPVSVASASPRSVLAPALLGIRQSAKASKVLRIAGRYRVGRPVDGSGLASLVSASPSGSVH